MVAEAPVAVKPHLAWAQLLVDSYGEDLQEFRKPTAAPGQTARFNEPSFEHALDGIRQWLGQTCGRPGATGPSASSDTGHP